MNPIAPCSWLLGFILIILGLSLNSCASKTLVIAPNLGPEPNEELEFYDSRSLVVETARKEIGDPYLYAGNGPEKWDCSGLTHHAYGKASIPTERVARLIAKMADGIAIKKSQPGDLIFFEKDGRVFHVSIITERNQNELWVVHSTTSRGVIEEDIMDSSYWKPKIHKVISLAVLAK